MTITVITPQTGDPFGPGFVIEVSTDTIGPFAPGTAWSFTLTAPANEEIVAQVVEFFTSSSKTTTILNGGSSTPIPALARPEWVAGQSGQLRVQIEEPGSGVVEQTDVPIVLDRQTGLGTELRKYMEWAVAASGQGLTTEEHNAILQTNVGVIAMAQINPLDLIGDLAAALSTNPPLAFGSLSTFYTLTGDGAMPDIGDILHTKLGIYFVATIPAGLSHRHGQSEEYPARLIQWRTVHLVGGIEMVTEVVDFITHGELWKWSVGKPLRIEYSVLPNVVVQAAWWQFP